MNRRRNRELKRGFTLVELLLVVAILGILATVVVVKVAGRQEEAMIKSTRASIASVGTAIDLYEVDTGRLPPSLESLVKASGEPNWNGPYVSGGVPKDAWGTTLGYTKRDARTYELRSAGPDLQIGNEDDLTN